MSSFHIPRDVDMGASVLELSASELDAFKAAVLEGGKDPEDFALSAMRYQPTHGATTEVVTVRSRVSGKYARNGGSWVDEFRAHLLQGEYEPLDW